MEAKAIWKFCIVMQVVCFLGWIVGAFLMMQERAANWNLQYIIIPLVIWACFNAGSWIARANISTGEAPNKERRKEDGKLNRHSTR